MRARSLVEPTGRLGPLPAGAADCQDPPAFVPQQLDALVAYARSTPAACAALCADRAPLGTGELTPTARDGPRAAPRSDFRARTCRRPGIDEPEHSSRPTAGTIYPPRPSASRRSSALSARPARLHAHVPAPTTRTAAARRPPLASRRKYAEPGCAARAVRRGPPVLEHAGHDDRRVERSRSGGDADRPYESGRGSFVEPANRAPRAPWFSARRPEPLPVAGAASAGGHPSLRPRHLDAVGRNCRVHGVAGKCASCFCCFYPSCRAVAPARGLSGLACSPFCPSTLTRPARRSTQTRS